MRCSLKDEKREHLCRVMAFDRQSTYQLEQYFLQLTQIHMLRMSSFVATPVGIHTADKKTVHMVYPLRQSLHDLLHGPAKVELSSF